MSLIKSKSPKAFSHNIKAEMDAGKPQNQSLAIAYATKRAASKKKMALGGRVSADSRDAEELEMLEGKSPAHEAEIRAAAMRPSADAKDRREMQMLAKGGELDARDEDMLSINDEYDLRDMSMLDSHPLKHKDELKAAAGMPSADSEDEMELSMSRFAKGGMVDAIMKKRKMAEGGEANLHANQDESLNLEDDLSWEAARKHPLMGDDLDDIHQPEDSNEHGDELSDEDSHDMVSSIRKKMRNR